MRTIDIQTTQKVTVNYQLATFWERFLALAIDLTMLAVFLGLFNLFLLFFDQGGAVEIVRNVIIAIVLYFHALTCEIFFNGQTLGKLALGIRVVKLNGSKLNITDCVIRWCFRLIDVFLSCGAIAAVTMNSTNKGQRLGDLLANTTVIKSRSKLNFKLKTILAIKTTESYKPQYPQVKLFKEQEMILVKTILERVKKHPNPAHQKALNDIVDKIVIQLDVTKPKDKVGFLNTLIKDYIVLTR
ncbi:MAG: RDD family protein [Bacteroidetes bacterium]|nr:RDD family protein [Bacteroidota bacterium]